MFTPHGGGMAFGWNRDGFQVGLSEVMDQIIDDHDVLKPIVTTGDSL